MSQFYQRIDDPIARHARPLVAMLEQRIQDEFGLAVHMAYEKEFTMQMSAPAKAKHLSTEIGAALEGHRAERHYTIQRRLGKTQRPILEKFENEDDFDLFEFQTKRTTPLRAIERIDGQTQLVEHYGSKAARKGRKTSPEDVKALNDLLTTKYGMTIRDVSFDPQHEIVFEKNNYYISAGLHVNFSLWSKDGHNLMDERAHKEFAPTVKNISRILFAYTLSDMLLIAPNEQAFDRFARFDSHRSERNFCELHSADDKREKRKKVRAEDSQARLEFRTPAANARHDLAALMTLTAIYEALRETPETSKFRLHTKHPATFQDAASMFEQSSQLIADLRDITEPDSPMRKHVDALKTEILQAAQENRLHQPTLAELQAKNRPRQR